MDQKIESQLTLQLIDIILEQSFYGRYKGETRKQYLITMVDFLYGSKDSDSDRAVLIKYYSSQCMAHGVYLVAIAIGLLSFVGVLPYFWSVAFLSRVVILGLISSTLLTLTIHILGRALFWSHMASAIIRTAPKREGEVKTEEGATATSLFLLHHACNEYVRRKHKIAGAFYTARMWEIELWFILLISFLLGWLVLSL